MLYAVLILPAAIVHYLLFGGLGGGFGFSFFIATVIYVIGGLGWKLLAGRANRRES